MKHKILAASFIAIAVIGAGAFWKGAADARKKNFRPFPDGEVPRSIFPAGARSVFKNSDQVTIYVITESSKTRKSFHGYEILQSKRFNAAQRGELRKIFEENAKRKGMKALCFWPQHGIRMRHKNQTLDFTICFQCGQIYTYFKGRETRETFAAQGANEFNALWKSAGLSPQKSPFPP